MAKVVPTNWKRTLRAFVRVTTENARNNHYAHEIHVWPIYPFQLFGGFGLRPDRCRTSSAAKINSINAPFDFFISWPSEWWRAKRSAVMNERRSHETLEQIKSFTFMVFIGLWPQIRRIYYYIRINASKRRAGVLCAHNSHATWDNAIRLWVRELFRR